jgi:hypothetical protein
VCDGTLLCIADMELWQLEFYAIPDAPQVTLSAESRGKPAATIDGDFWVAILQEGRPKRDIHQVVMALCRCQHCPYRTPRIPTAPDIGSPATPFPCLPCLPRSWCAMLSTSMPIVHAGLTTHQSPSWPWHHRGYVCCCRHSCTYSCSFWQSRATREGARGSWGELGINHHLPKYHLWHQAACRQQLR